MNIYNDSTEEDRVIGWWSGGVASAVACKIALEKYPNVHLAFCDTNAEHPDTYRFMQDFEKELGVKIHTYRSEKFKNPEEVWFKYLGLNFAHGAPCSSELKRAVRIKVQKTKTDHGQIFGFDYCKKEINRATNMQKNYPEINPLFPLIENEITRDGIFKELKKLNLTPPETYKDFLNNNCILIGCVQAGIGHWGKFKSIYPDRYNYMAEVEHKLSAVKGRPVTIHKDQRKNRQGNRLFLKHNPDYPEIGTIDEIEGKWPVIPFECNGFCSTQQEMF